MKLWFWWVVFFLILCSHPFLHRTALVFCSLSFKSIFWWHLLPGSTGSDQRVDSTDVACGSRMGVCGPRAVLQSSHQAPGTRPQATWPRVSENVGRCTWGCFPGKLHSPPLPIKQSSLFRAQLVAEARDTISLPSSLSGSYLALAIFDKWKSQAPWQPSPCSHKAQ